MPTQAGDPPQGYSNTYEQLNPNELESRKRQRPMPPSLPSPPYGGNLPYTPLPPSSLPPVPIKMRRYRLLEPGEGEGMEIADITACQSLEAFEADHQNIHDGFSGESIALGQLGIRCVHCLPGNAYSTLYPQVTENIASCIQLLSDRHLSECAEAPPKVRDTCAAAAAKRQQVHEQRNQLTEQEERHHIAFIDHCRYFAENIGLVDKFPPKSGVVVGDTVYRPMEPPPEFYAQQSIYPSGIPFPPTPFQAPPTRPGQMMPDIAATPLARRNKQLGMDRDFQSNSFPPHNPERHYPPSADRERGFTPFQHHPSAPRAFYPSEASQDARAAVVPPTSDSSQAPTPQTQLKDSPNMYAAQHHPHYDNPMNDFPYFQDMGGSWICRYCSHIHPHYRDPGAVWSAPNYSPPSGQFIDQHLSMCRSFNQVAPMGYYEGPPPTIPPYGYGPGSQYMPPPYHPGPPPPNWGQPGPNSPYPAHDQTYPYPPQPPMDHSGTIYPPPPNMEPESSQQRNSRSQSRPQTSRSMSESQDTDMVKAIDVLVHSDHEHFGASTIERESKGSLVLEEDKLLLTDYFFHLMRQLKLCRFSEADRKTRGGKRENIKVGYGGLQCVHCSEAPNSRKFFWSNVDRLANSFAEIPGHVLKCRRCPVPIKNALMELKRRHPEQMARLPRGSQKVFFRRMWRRLHDDEADVANSMGAGDQDSICKSNDGSTETTPTSPKELVPKEEDDVQGESHDNLDEGMPAMERSTVEAAKALAACAHGGNSSSPASRIRLAITEDKEWLSDMDCFIRRNLEVFCATEDDVMIAQEDKKYPITLGQVGIRCWHCATAKDYGTARGTAVAFPYSINGIYESVREFQRMHLESCPNLPEATRQKLEGFKGSTSLSSVLRKFYVLAARALGMHDTSEGIRSGGETVSLGSSANSVFSSSDNASQGLRTAEDHHAIPDDTTYLQTAVTPLESRKRKATITLKEELQSHESPLQQNEVEL
jgi:hypothetical protein